MVRRLATDFISRRAKELRKAPPPSEAALWQLLRKSQVGGLKFRRRSVILGWIPDFWCPEVKLAIEIDASDTPAKRTRDAVRDARLAAEGIHTLHVAAVDIFRSPTKVRSRILAAARAQNSRHAMPNEELKPTAAQSSLIE